MLPRLRAERQMAAIEAASFSDMDKEGRRDVLGKYRPDMADAQAKAVRPSEGELAALGIQVEHVGADGLPAERDKLGQEEG